MTWAVAVAGMYGRVPKWVSPDGQTGYIYNLNQGREIIFYVNDRDIITEIYYGTDW